MTETTKPAEPEGPGQSEDAHTEPGKSEDAPGQQLDAEAKPIAEDDTEAEAEPRRVGE